MRGLKIGLLTGAIMGSNRRKKNDGQYHQPGGCLLYLGIPIAGFLIALNSYFWVVDYENPYPWVTPLVIFIGSILLVAFIVWVRKWDREEHKRQMELKKKQWLDSLGSKRIKRA